MTAISSPDDASINWFAAFACYGGNGADETVVVPFLIAPGGNLGWHTDSLEETQYIIAGSGELQRLVRSHNASRRLARSDCGSSVSAAQQKHKDKSVGHEQRRIEPR